MRFKLRIMLLLTACLTFTACSQSSAPNLMNSAENSADTMLMQTAEQTRHVKSIVLGLGCFWGAEKKFAALPGVIDVVSGYADGRGVKPEYQEIIQRKNKFNPNNFAEVIEVTYHPEQISLESLYQTFFEIHDPTQGNRQGNDIGTQYRSTILYESEKDAALANKVKAQFQALLKAKGFGQITTKIKPLKEFFPAEDYHQDYLVKNPNGYCPDHSTGVTFNPDANKDSDEHKELVDNSGLTKGKQLVVIDSEYCPYCDKFKQDVANDYQGDIPMTFRRASELDGLSITSPTWATPTLLFIEYGKEQLAIQGYVNAKDFYKALGYFKLGKSEAFNVAFNEGTDSRFCKQYELFKNTPDGQFIDKLSGAPLFDTKHRFNSGSGWLSFTQPIEGSVYYKEDRSYGMVRTEVRAKLSDIHLGHVFNDGPNGKPRYCINATVLDFKARESGNI